MRFLTLILFASTLRLGAQPAEFQVNASGTDPTIDAAIAFTTDIWSQQLISDQPISINLVYLNLTALGPLGITFPNGEKNFTVAPIRDLWYPSCLANKLMGWDLQPSNPDMDIYINSSVNWYFGTDGNPGAFQFDFVSVLLHEIGHGLGFLSLAKVEDGLGSFGELDAGDFSPLGPSFPFPDLGGFPSVLDHWLRNAGGDILTDTSLFPNLSFELLLELTSNNVFYEGPAGVLANTGTKVRIHAPGTFSLGTTMTHLNESTFLPGGGNSLMTPFIGPGEVESGIGSIVLGIFEDIGWTIVPSAVKSLDQLEDRARFFPNPFSDKATVQLNLTQSGKVRIEIFDLLGRLVHETIESALSSGKHQLYLKGAGLPEGNLLYRVTLPGGVISGKLYHQTQPF